MFVSSRPGAQYTHTHTRARVVDTQIDEQIDPHMSEVQTCRKILTLTNTVTHKYCT